MKKLNNSNIKSLSSVESFTGGAFSARIVSISGASNFFKGSITTYQNKIKEKLGIDTKDGVVNKKTALAMTKQGNLFFESDVCVSFTGSAGPTPLDNKKVGTVFIAINDDVYELHFRGNRKQIIRKSINFAIDKLNLI